MNLLRYISVSTTGRRHSIAGTVADIVEYRRNRLMTKDSDIRWIVPDHPVGHAMIGEGILRGMDPGKPVFYQKEQTLRIPFIKDDITTRNHIFLFVLPQSSGKIETVRSLVLGKTWINIEPEWPEDAD